MESRIVSEGMDLGASRVTIEQGRMARLASGAVTIRFGDTVVLAAAVAGRQPLSGDFIPLTVDYRAKFYAAGKIPGGFFKREGRPHEKEILSARLVDRCLRPLFTKEFPYELQVMLTVLSSDGENDADVLAIVGASAAATISDIPFGGPVGAVRVAKVDDRLLVNPTLAQREEAEMELVIAGTRETVLMVEGGAREVGEQDMLAAIQAAMEPIRGLIELQEKMAREVGRPKRELVKTPNKAEIERDVRERYLAAIDEAIAVPVKEQRELAVDAIRQRAAQELAERYPDQPGAVRQAVDAVERQRMRNMILENGRRADGRGWDEIRDIHCEVGVLPRTHGSALFTRGQTQSLGTTTLGTGSDEQKIDDLEGEGWKSYMLHYNFPPFSVNETRPIRGPGRREIGHGALAERALAPVIPPNESFPYTIRVVSEILESNGSSSMASVCSASLSLMDAGVPIKSGVAGVAMGLVKEGDRVAVLTDILGVEDHLGDMDFKVAGTRQGITSFQMDVKTRDLTFDIFSKALEQARRARLHILDRMETVLARSRPELSSYAPRIIVIQINRERIRDLIGPGGKVIRKLTEDTGASIDVEDDGTVKIASVDAAAGRRALEMVKALVEDPEIGKVYHGLVKRVVDFGAFVEILPGRDGLLHISEIETSRIDRVEDVLREGDRVDVKVIAIDREGKVKLSRKALLLEAAGQAPGRGRD